MVIEEEENNEPLMPAAGFYLYTFKRDSCQRKKGGADSIRFKAHHGLPQVYTPAPCNDVEYITY